MDNWIHILHYYFTITQLLNLGNKQTETAIGGNAVRVGAYLVGGTEDREGGEDREDHWPLEGEIAGGEHQPGEGGSAHQARGREEAYRGDEAARREGEAEAAGSIAGEGGKREKSVG